MSGWIKFHRKILENEIWHDVITFRLFTLLLLKASHQDGIKIRGIEINRGQYLRSYSKLAEDLEYKEKRGYKKVAKSTILRSVKKLVSEGMVSVSETDSGTLFTIAKYHEYQGSEGDDKNVIETVNEPLSKRNRNDIETTSKQEQELKNLRIKELKNNTSTTNDDAIVFYQNNIGMIRPHMSEEILDWINDFGDEMVIVAMKRSLERNKPSWGYTKSILKSWQEKNIKSIDQAKAEEVEFQNQQSSKKSFYPKQQSQEIVPDWFKNRDDKSSNQPKQQKNQTEIAKEQQELAELLKQYS